MGRRHGIGHVRESHIYLSVVSRNFVILASFVPSGESLHSVHVVMSEYGREKLALEDVKGPPLGDFEAAAREHFDGGEVDDTILGNLMVRLYEEDRRRYFYAVVTFSSPTAALNVYANVDGEEVEKTGSVFDLRFVPDDCELDISQPRDLCTEMPDRYRKVASVASTTQMSKARLSWDQTDPKRYQMLTRRFDGEDEQLLDMAEYLAPGDMDDEDEEAEGRGEYLDLLKTDRNAAPTGDLEIEFVSSFDSGVQDKIDALVAKRDHDALTPWEQVQLKKKKRKSKGKVDPLDMPIASNPDEFLAGQDAVSEEEEVEEEESAADDGLVGLLVAGADTEAGHVDLAILDQARKLQDRSINKRGKARRQATEKLDGLLAKHAWLAGCLEGQDVDTKDSRFSAVFDGKERAFAVDTTHAEYRATSASDQIAAERRAATRAEPEEPSAKRGME
ncbi:hypothetical protein KIPB_004173 [Kipferlia bialata]|uniref:NUC153 domain-containing protein n=1 Tax=Kipferlia bialata TaxID=797122 RepID=A0A9K3CUY1_9EUKA|nr:hypothetical protein KIPB_004173 [Kipferlia bialata]|eukprot:g4173.t1